MTLFGWQMNGLPWLVLSAEHRCVTLAFLARVEVAFSMSIWFQMTEKIFYFDLHKIFSPVNLLVRHNICPCWWTEKRACFALWLEERGILHLKRTFLFVCLFFLVIERGILHLKRAKWLENRKLSNPGEMTGYHWSYTLRVNLTRLEPVKEEDLCYLGWT